MLTPEVKEVLLNLLVGGPIFLAILAMFRMAWRIASGGTEVTRLREELAELRRENERSRARLNEALQGMDAAIRRLEARVEDLSRTEEPIRDGAPRSPAERHPPEAVAEGARAGTRARRGRGSA